VAPNTLASHVRNDCIAVIALAAAAIAQSGATVTRTFLVGLGSTETAQVAVVNLANAPSSGPAASCTGSIAFFNAAGTAIGTATTFTLGTGQVASARLPFRNRRRLRRPRLDPRRGDFHPNRWIGRSCTPAATLDTFDNSNGGTNRRYAGEEAISADI